jgi:ankyrin repeat protein
MDMGWTPAHCAAEAGKLNCLRALHTAGVSVCKKDKYNDKPVDVATVYNYTDCANFLKQ